MVYTQAALTGPLYKIDYILFLAVAVVLFCSRQLITICGFLLFVCADADVSKQRYRYNADHIWHWFFFFLLYCYCDY